MPCVRQDSEALDVDHGQLIGRRLEDIAVVMSLEKLAPVGGWTAVGCDRWRLKRSAKMGQNLADWARLRETDGFASLSGCSEHSSRRFVAPIQPAACSPAGFSARSVTMPTSSRSTAAWPMLPRQRRRSGGGGQAAQNGLHEGQMRGEPAEDQGHEFLPIDVAACVAVFVDLHGCTILRVVQEPSGERLLQGAPRAVRHLPSFRLQARADMFPEQFSVSALLELLDSSVLGSIPSDLRHAVTVEGKQICEALQCPPNIVSA